MLYFKTYRLGLILLALFTLTCKSTDRKYAAKTEVVSFNKFIINRNEFHKKKVILKDTFFHSINLNYTIDVEGEKCYVMFVSKLDNIEEKVITTPLLYLPKDILIIYVPIVNKELASMILNFKKGDKIKKISGIGSYPEADILLLHKMLKIIQVTVSINVKNIEL